MEPQRQEGNEEEAAAQLDELDQLRQGEQEAAVANELDDSEPQRQEVQEEAIGIAEEEDTEGAEAEEEENQRNEHIMFRGIEFLERDPALRPQIWQYPNDQRDQVRRAYLQLGPMQPLLKKYKPSGPQGHQRVSIIFGSVNFCLGWNIPRAAAMHIVFSTSFVAKI